MSSFLKPVLHFLPSHYNSDLWILTQTWCFDFVSWATISSCDIITHFTTTYTVVYINDKFNDNLIKLNKGFSIYWFFEFIYWVLIIQFYRTKKKFNVDNNFRNMYFNINYVKQYRYLIYKYKAIWPKETLQNKIQFFYKH